MQVATDRLSYRGLDVGARIMADARGSAIVEQNSPSVLDLRRREDVVTAHLDDPCADLVRRFPHRTGEPFVPAVRTSDAPPQHVTQLGSRCGVDRLPVG